MSGCPCRCAHLVPVTQGEIGFWGAVGQQRAGVGVFGEDFDGWRLEDGDVFDEVEDGERSLSK